MNESWFRLARPSQLRQPSLPTSTSTFRLSFLNVLHLYLILNFNYELLIANNTHSMRLEEPSQSIGVEVEYKVSSDRWSKAVEHKVVSSHVHVPIPSQTLVAEPRSSCHTGQNVAASHEDCEFKVKGCVADFGGSNEPVSNFGSLELEPDTRIVVEEGSSACSNEGWFKGIPAGHIHGNTVTTAKSSNTLTSFQTLFHLIVERWGSW